MKVFAALLSLGSILVAAECVPSNLDEKERLAKFQELDRTAQGAFDRGQYVAAERHYSEAVCLVPESGRALYGLGIAEAASGKFAAGRKALERAFAMLPHNAMPLAMLVRVDVAMKDVDHVKEDLRIAAQRFPNDAELHSGLTRFLAENQLLDLALAESLRFEQTGASDAASVVALAILENTVGAYEDAIRNGLAIEEQGEHGGVPDTIRASAAGVTGLSYEGIGERDQGVKHLARAVELAPSQENSYLALADLYEKAHQFGEAVKVLKLGRERLPQSIGFLLPLGNNLIWAEQYEDGVRVLNELIQKKPDTPEAYLRLAEAYRNTGRPALEVQTLGELARIKPDYPMVQVLTAKAMMTMDPVDYPSVLLVLAQAEKSTPNDADIHYLRGRAYAATGRGKEAVVAFQRAIELRPMDPSPYYQLGLAYRKLGRADLAREAFSRMEHVKQTVNAP
jgi:tetratricopeptide (TPR) repeat protein